MTNREKYSQLMWKVLGWSAYSCTKISQKTNNPHTTAQTYIHSTYTSQTHTTHIHMPHTHTHHTTHHIHTSHQKHTQATWTPHHKHTHTHATPETHTHHTHIHATHTHTTPHTHITPQTHTDTTQHNTYNTKHTHTPQIQSCSKPPVASDHWPGWSRFRSVSINTGNVSDSRPVLSSHCVWW